MVQLVFLDSTHGNFSLGIVRGLNQKTHIYLWSLQMITKTLNYKAEPTISNLMLRGNTIGERKNTFGT